MGLNRVEPREPELVTKRSGLRSSISDISPVELIDPGAYFGQCPLDLSHQFGGSDPFTGIGTNWYVSLERAGQIAQDIELTAVESDPGQHLRIRAQAPEKCMVSCQQQGVQRHSLRTSQLYRRQ